jgi:hypothetical protein
MEDVKMNKLLPLVDADVGHSVANSLCGGCEIDDVEAWKCELKKIKRNNPVIAEFIQKWTKMSSGRENQLHTLICGVCVYKLLESQAEADRMMRELKLE